jgi:hypothetical protein
MARRCGWGEVLDHVERVQRRMMEAISLERAAALKRCLSCAASLPRKDLLLLSALVVSC